VSRLRTFIAIFLLTGCFDEPAPEVGAGTSAGETPQTSTGTPDPIDVCRECQASSCVEYSASCDGDPSCESCVDAPFSLSCIANAVFRPLAACSCQRCEAECGYMCPGEPAACRTCSIASECNPQTSACLGVPECAPCIEDGFAPGCPEEPNFDALNTCWCGECGPECVWQCDAAGSMCADCLLGPCEVEFAACMGDATCTACFANASGPECADDPVLAAVATCSCAMCNEQCGPLFDCG
jgi:hypothetical protein